MGEHVIKALKSDHPDVVEVYSKGDNASSYHGNFYPESLYHICKQNGIILRQLDYNELQKGKDQCDRESTVARNMMRCFVDEGNDTLTAEDTYKALVNSKMKNIKVSVVSFQKNECEVDGDKIVNISNYHYTEFTREGLKLWRYYGISSGNFLLFSKNWSFQSGLRVVTYFTKCADNIEPTTAEAKNPDLTKQRKRKQRNNHQLYNLIFCTAAHCSATFETFDELESHIVKGIPSVPKAASSFDYVKKSFANRMILAARSHSFVTSSPTASASNPLSAVIPLFLQQGWGLPIRLTFRFNAAQKSFLFKAFENGERTGKIESPEEVHLDMRKNFSSEEYYTVKQIRSLFSR